MSSPSQLPKSSIPKKSPRATIDVVNAFLTSCERRNLSPYTLRWYKSFLVSLAKQYPELPTAPEPLEDFIGSLNTGDERRHGCYRALRVFFNFAERRLGTKNPVRKILPPKRKVKEKPALTRQELKQVLEYPGRTPMVSALLYLLADTGCRIGEASNLTSDCIFESSVKLDGKTGARIIPISPAVRKMLLDLGQGRLFPHTSWWLQRLVSRAFKAAGIPGSSKTMRHTFCTLWKGTDLCLKTITGHKSWAMIENYSHRKLEKASEEHSLYSPLAQLDRDNGNGKQQSQGPPSTPAGTVPLQARDELALLLDKSTSYDPGIAVAEFVFHGLLHNMAKNALEVVEEYARRGEIKDYFFRYLYDCAEGNQDPGNELDKELLVKDVIGEASAVWSTVALLLRPVVAEHQTQALIYRQLYDSPEGELEAVQLNDVSTIWQR